MNNHWETQPRDDNGRFASRAASAARSAAHPGTSSFGGLNALNDVVTNPYVLNTAKIGLAVGSIALATRTGNYQPAVGALRHFTTGAGGRAAASHVYFRTPHLKTAVFGTAKNNIQAAGQAFGYRRAVDDKIRGAVKGSVAGKINDNPFSKGFTLGKLPYQTWEL